MANEVKGFRGYIASRPIRDTNYPQAVQNLVVRDYASRSGVLYKLSATEYAMRGCYMILESVIAELPELEGVILFSLFMLPEDAAQRARIYEAFLSSGKVLHAALESMVLRSRADIARFEEVLEVDRICCAVPAGV